MKTLITRSISGLIFLVIMIGAIVVGPYTFSLLSFILMIIGLNEFSRLKDDLFKQKISRFIFYLSGITIFYIITIPSLKIFSFDQTIWAGVIILLGIIVLYLKHRSVKKSLQIFAGYVYVSLPFALLATFHFLNDLRVVNDELLLGFFIILWSNDVFAYLVGTAIGRTKLAKKISPKKTWEGTIGGIILSILAAYILSIYFLSLDMKHWLVLAIIISIFATLGDLLESKLKRRAGVKDSGKLMPGHGGVLDRFDGMLLSAPLVFLYLSVV